MRSWALEPAAHCRVVKIYAAEEPSASSSVGIADFARARASTTRAGPRRKLSEKGNTDDDYLHTIHIGMHEVAGG